MDTGFEARRARRKARWRQGQPPAAFHPWQITLHWLTLGLLVAMYMPPMLAGTSPHGTLPLCMGSHAQLGLVVLLVTVWRLVLRLSLGVPHPEAHEPRLLRGAGRIAHSLLYVGLLLMALSGISAWYLHMHWAVVVHRWTADVLLGLIAVHTLSALVHHFVLHSPVLWRMLFVYNPPR